MIFGLQYNVWPMEKIGSKYPVLLDNRGVTPSLSCIVSHMSYPGRQGTLLLLLADALSFPGQQTLWLALLFGSKYW